MSRNAAGPQGGVPLGQKKKLVRQLPCHLSSPTQLPWHLNDRGGGSFQYSPRQNQKQGPVTLASGCAPPPWQVIKPFKEKPKLPANFEEESWAKLQLAIEALARKESVAVGYEELYQAVEALCLHKMAPRLYTRLQAEVRHRGTPAFEKNAFVGGNNGADARVGVWVHALLYGGRERAARWRGTW